MTRSNNAPDVVLELSDAQASFLVENSDANIAFALAALDADLSDDASRRLVENIEMFKSIRRAVEKARE